MSFSARARVIGAMTTRFFNVRPQSVKGEKRILMEASEVERFEAPGGANILSLSCSIIHVEFQSLWNVGLKSNRRYGKPGSRGTVTLSGTDQM